MSGTTARKRSLLKIVVLGDSHVGKTSILSQYVNKFFDARYRVTIGADFLTKELDVDGNLLSLQIWDTAGQERFQSLGSAFYRGADACVLVFDLTNAQTFKNVSTWLDEFHLHTGKNQHQVILIGNKKDLESQREVEANDAVAWCRERTASDDQKYEYFETSAATNDGLDAVFMHIARTMIARQPEDQPIYVPPAVDVGSRKPRRQGGCCK